MNGTLGKPQLKMNIKHTGSIDELIKRNDRFCKLQDKAIFEYSLEDIRALVDGERAYISKHDWYRWQTPQTQFFEYQKEVSLVTAMFIGKTGYGKSSLLNAILGFDLFPTDDIRVCTTEMDAAIYRLGKSPKYYLSLCDLPGVGENENADKNYMVWYTELMASSPCVVYVLRADQRDYSIDQVVFRKLFSTKEDRNKVIIALTFADKIEPWNRGTELSNEQLESLEKKSASIEELFGIDSYNIFPCCSQTGYGINELIDELILTMSLGHLYDAD